MADQDDAIRAERPKGWAIQPADDGHSIIVFQRHSGPPIGVVMTADDMSRFAQRIIAEAGRLAAAAAPGNPPRNLTTQPIPTSAIGIARHPQDPSAALVAIQTGNLTLAYQMDLGMLAAQARDLLARVTSAAPPSR